jgi:hypothetical protein
MMARGSKMLRTMIILATIVSVLSTPGHTQDSQSLGDLARQLRSQKSGAQPKTIITNDDLSSTSAVDILGLGKMDDPKSSVTGGANRSPVTDLDQWESFVKKMDLMDRATLVKLALQGAKADFPGRSSWEERLFTAKQVYVFQGRGLIQRARQLAASAQALKSAQASAEDPRVKQLVDDMQGLVREAFQSDATFQAVILEGRDLAHPAPAH